MLRLPKVPLYIRITSSDGKEKISIGGEVGVGALGGGEASITRDGAAAFKQVLGDIKDIVLPPSPPSPPPPPPPPENAGKLVLPE